MHVGSLFLLLNIDMGQFCEVWAALTLMWFSLCVLMQELLMRPWHFPWCSAAVTLRVLGTVTLNCPVFCISHPSVCVYSPFSFLFFLVLFSRLAAPLFFFFSFNPVVSSSLSVAKNRLSLGFCQPLSLETSLTGSKRHSLKHTCTHAHIQARCFCSIAVIRNLIKCLNQFIHFACNMIHECLVSATSGGVRARLCKYSASQRRHMSRREVAHEE